MNLTLIDLCSFVKILIIDPEGVYDPLIGNDRLLLGLLCDQTHNNPYVV